MANTSPRRSVDLISIRQSLARFEDVSTTVIIREGSSSLLYYLFDNWNTSYRLLLGFQRQLSDISSIALSPPSQDPQDSLTIIQQLYIITRSLRREEHLHRGYKNLIKRILEHGSTSNLQIKAFMVHPQDSKPFTKKSMNVVLSLAASMRFQRLSDRINLLILATLEQLTLEKESLLTTHFNLTAQRDSHNNTKLSQNATLLSTLGVLFLPVSLMTAYFSIQVQGVDVYTIRDYWASFGIVCVLSFMALIFANRWLIGFWCWTEETMKRGACWLESMMVSK